MYEKTSSDQGMKQEVRRAEDGEHRSLTTAVDAPLTADTKECATASAEPTAPDQTSQSTPSPERSTASGQAGECAPAAGGESRAPGTLTHSRLTCFRDCPRKHYLRYELGLTADREGVPLRIGSAFHLAMEMYDNGIAVTPDSLELDDPYEQAMVMAMFAGHVERYAAEEDAIEPVAAELEFDIALVNPETGRPTPVWRFRGKIDRIVRLGDGRLALQEYKTTTRDFSPGAEYWQRLHMDQQLSIYILAARELGYQIDTVLYDVTRRPMLKPLKATPEDKRKYNKKTGELYKGQRAEDETPAEYGARVLADIQSRPEHYFSRIEIARLDQDLEDCRAEVWQQQLAIREAQRSGRWYRNPNNCFGMFACDYLPICLNRDLETHTPNGFVRLEDVHPELGEPAPVEG